MNSVKAYYKIDAIFMNFGNSTTSDPHRLLINLSEEVKLKGSDKSVDLSNQSIYCQRCEPCKSKMWMN